MLSFTRVLFALAASSLVVNNSLAATSKKADDATPAQSLNAVAATTPATPTTPTTPASGTIPGKMEAGSCTCPAPVVCPGSVPDPMPAASSPVPAPDLSVVSPTSKTPEDTTSGGAALGASHFSGLLAVAAAAMLL